MFPGSVMQLPGRHSYIQLSAKYARRNIDHVRLRACPWGRARFAVTYLVGRGISESREISSGSSLQLGVDKTGWNVVLG